MERSWRWHLILLSLLALGACGPIQATTGISLANKHLFEARLAKADVLVPGQKYITPAQYEYQLALLYLEKSKELEGFAKFEHASFYARLAADLGLRAVEHKKDEIQRQERRDRIRKGEVLPKVPTKSTTLP